jgi:hypothetical protein
MEQVQSRLHHGFVCVGGATGSLMMVAVVQDFEGVFLGACLNLGGGGDGSLLACGASLVPLVEGYT